jgi:hypothetical protein
MASVNLLTERESRAFAHGYRDDLPPVHAPSCFQFPGGSIRFGPKRGRKNRSYFSCREKGSEIVYVLEIIPVNAQYRRCVGRGLFRETQPYSGACIKRPSFWDSFSDPSSRTFSATRATSVVSCDMLLRFRASTEPFLGHVEARIPKAELLDLLSRN